jgi:hypothetical protein
VSTQPPVQWVSGALSLGIKWPWREADHSPPPSAEVKECVELHLCSSNTPLWHGDHLIAQRQLLPLPSVMLKVVFQGGYSGLTCSSNKVKNKSMHYFVGKSHEKQPLDSVTDERPTLIWISRK